jgi:hypothetical protein
MSDCGDYYTNAQTFGTGKTSVSGATLVDRDAAFPCGTIASVYYKLKDEISSFAFTPSTNIRSTGIAWPSDIGRHVAGPSSTSGINVTDERWLVWFRPAARSDFYKLNGIIDTEMAAGTYTVTFNNSTLSSRQTTTRLSGRNGSA